ncbi:MAG: 4Fe-4S dicluster domain-containing protein [Rhodospirillales bacterium]|nr:4Fe-4S dicluster domain-containing protein [Rhodospirillales bacterium]
MKRNAHRILLCDCERSMTLDGKALCRAVAGEGDARVHTQLCRAEIAAFRDALAAGEGVLVACTQEAPIFTENAAEIAPDADLRFANIRESAGWSAEATEAGPKIAALIAAAAEPFRPTPTVTLRSEGSCLVYGRDEVAIEAARQVRGKLDVTVLLADPGEVAPPRVMDLPIFKGRVAGARGHLGAFEIVVDDYAPAIVSSRGRLSFEPGRDGASAGCDIIIDLSGGVPLFPSGKREGYLRADPGDPAAVQRTLFAAIDLVGEFEKPRYVDFHAELCAYARSRKTGCTKCLEVCPTGAIEPAGDSVAIDPYICAGCGSCHSVCPTGAADYAMPLAADLLGRLRTLLRVYREAGGTEPVLLVHDGEHGADMIAALAHHGRGLPARVIPFAVNETTQLGLDFLSSAFSYGAARVLVLTRRGAIATINGLAAQIGVMESVLAGLGHGGGRIEILETGDPEILEQHLWALAPLPAPRAAGHLPMGGKREQMRLAFNHLHSVAPQPVEVLALPPGAPFGRVLVETAGCTLCLACVGACPTGALIDNPEKPQLAFREEACVQCGICRATCPEKVIRLEPRLNFANAAETVVIKEEEPFNCIRCGKPFGTKSSIERVVAQLAEKHWMFQDGGAIDRMRMCGDCRVTAQFEAGNDPLAAAPRRVPRTTEDYLKEREAEQTQAQPTPPKGNGQG